MTTSASEGTKYPKHRAWALGVRGRLLLAFFGIAAFAALAAAAGIYAFREVGDRLDIVDLRIPSTLSALELSRSAERIIAAAPALLAATDRNRRDEIKAALVSEVARLNAKLVDLKADDAGLLPLSEIEPIVSSLTANLVALENLVARRLESNERIGALRRNVFQTNDQTQRLLAPWLEILGGEITALVEAGKAGRAGTGDQSEQLASLIELQRLMRATQAQVSVVAELLAEASTADQPRRLQVLAFQLDLAVRELEGLAPGLGPELRPLLLEQIAEVRTFTEGPNAIAEVRKQELLLVGEGERLVTEATRLSARLTAAVDQLGSAAKQEISAAISDALSVQRLSTRALLVVVAMSLLTSILIVWLYVGRNIARRLGALGDSMLAIAGGGLETPVAVEGGDEIAAMGRAAEVLRRNTLERDELLAEKAQTADRLEKEVKQRTAELSEALERQHAANEILHIIASSPNDTQPVFDTIARSVARLCDVRFCQVFRFDGELIHFAAHYGLSPEAVDDIRRTYPLPPGRASAAARAILSGTIAQIPDVDADFDYTRHRFAKVMNFRSVMAVPMLKDGLPIGAIAMARSETGYFPERQINLLRTFADQAVVAIGNNRLFDEIQDKTRQLEVADKYKSHFLASASHDLRQPLHALNLFVAQLRAGSDPAEHERLVARIDAAVASMNELFESLLDMSKLEAGILEPHFAAFPLQRAFNRIETTFADVAGEKGLRLAVVQTSAWVRSDFVLLERILMNLVANAVHYTTQGGVVVGCRRRGDELRIDICDSGPGIPEEQQQRVFDEYYRLSDSEPDRRSGFGLGLAIVDRLGRMLGHRVELVSRVSRGSRFSLSVPLVVGQDAAAEAPATSALPDPAHGKLVLVIDDDALVLEGMGGILRSWGCTILTADSEEAALSTLAAGRQRPDLIISDYRLADGKTGIEAIGRLRDMLGAPIPAFLISGDTAPERLRDARRSGFHLLHKPVTAMRLRAVLNQLLRTPSPRASASAE